MSMIVGIYCQDGVVIGSDSAMTFVAGRTPTIEQITPKINVVGHRVVLTGTGAMGLGQRFLAIVKQSWNNGLFESSKSPMEIAKTLSRAGIEDFSFTHVERGQYGALLAFPCEHKACLCEFQLQDFQPELKTKTNWYVSMGGGQAYADPFLALMRDVFWKKGPPLLASGIFSTVWTIRHAIDVNVGGVKGPLQIAVLAPGKKGQLGARILDKTDIDQHLENVHGAKKHLSEYAEKVSGKREAPDLPEV